MNSPQQREKAVKCAQCDRTVKRTGLFEWFGHQLCSARCHGLYERAMRRAVVR